MKAVQTISPRATVSRTLSSTAFLDWGVAVGGVWLICGLYLDGWAHHRISLESFFTPWHAVLYSGFFFASATVGLAFLNGVRQGQPWRATLPAGYLTSLLGAVLFMLGGIADMTWHTLLGIEQSLEALLSPPHLLLAVSGSLLVTGPLRSALARHASDRTPGVPAVLSLLAFTGLVSFFTGYVHPWMEAADSASGLFLGVLPAFRMASSSQVHLLSGVLLQSALLAGVVLFLVRRWRIPFGTFTWFFTLLTALLVSQHEAFGLVPFGLIGGLAADLLYQALRPSATRKPAAHLFAFLTPLVFYALYFGAMKMAGQLFGWTLELWGGAVLLSGITGWLVSYAFFAPDGTTGAE